MLTSDQDISASLWTMGSQLERRGGSHGRPNTPGIKTSEWKAWLTGIAGSLALAGGNLLALGLIDDQPGFGAFEAITLIVTVLAGIGGVTLATNKYIGGRNAIKVTKAAGGGQSETVEPPKAA